MIVFATKLTVKKAAIGILALGAVVWGVVALAPQAVQSVSTAQTSLSQKLKTNEARVALLRDYGWEVEETPQIEMEVQIPEEFDAAYEEYNALQLRQGFDLSKYKGRRAKLYTYALLSYPTGEEGVTASLLLYRDKLIAADISSAAADGFMHGITEMPAQPDAKAEQTDAASQQAGDAGSGSADSTPDAAEKTPME